MKNRNKFSLLYFALAPLLVLVPVAPAVTAQIQQSIQSPIVETYEYDDAGRLVQVSYGDGPGIKYSYDANGSILSVEVLAGNKMFKDGFE